MNISLLYVNMNISLYKIFFIVAFIFLLLIFISIFIISMYIIHPYNYKKKFCVYQYFIQFIKNKRCTKLNYFAEVSKFFIYFL